VGANQHVQNDVGAKKPTENVAKSAAAIPKSVTTKSNSKKGTLTPMTGTTNQVSSHVNFKSQLIFVLETYDVAPKGRYEPVASSSNNELENKENDSTFTVSPGKGNIHVVESPNNLDKSSVIGLGPMNPKKTVSNTIL